MAWGNKIGKVGKCGIRGMKCGGEEFRQSRLP